MVIVQFWNLCGGVFLILCGYEIVKNVYICNDLFAKVCYKVFFVSFCDGWCVLCLDYTIFLRCFLARINRINHLQSENYN